MSSVRRSHFEDVVLQPAVCQSAVLRRKGVLGARNFSRAEGEASIVAGEYLGEEMDRSIYNSRERRSALEKSISVETNSESQNRKNVEEQGD